MAGLIASLSHASFYLAGACCGVAEGSLQLWLRLLSGALLQAGDGACKVCCYPPPLWRPCLPGTAWL